MNMEWNPDEAVRAHAAATRPDRPERRLVELTGHALHEDGHGFHMRVVNLSYDGCAVATDEPLEVGQAFKLSVLGRGGIDVEVMWAEDGKAGLRFAETFEATDGRTPRSAEQSGFFCRRKSRCAAPAGRTSRFAFATCRHTAAAASLSTDPRLARRCS